jgi:hypothetical protein
VHGHGQVRRTPGVGFGRGQNVDVFGKAQGSRHGVVRVVVAPDHDHLDAVSAQPGHLLGEMEQGLVVRAVGVVHVPGQDDQGNGVVHGVVHQVGQCLTGRSPDFVHGRAFIPGQSVQRAVQVDVGDVEEGKHAGRAIGEAARIGSSDGLADVELAWLTQVYRARGIVVS